MQHKVAIGDVLHHAAAAGGRLERMGAELLFAMTQFWMTTFADAAGGLAAHVDAGPRRQSGSSR